MLIKIDLLCIDALDKIFAELQLLLKDGVIQWQGSLKDTYTKYVGVKTLERDSLEMWKMLWEHKVLSLFQMEKESGKQALALVKPRSVDDLATINSVIRLMAQEEGAETPLQKYARFHENIEEWYKEMREYGLTEHEQDILKEILGVSYGICEAQEYLVLLTGHPEIGGFDLVWGDRLRKAVAKKKPKDFMQLEKEYFDNAKEKGLSEKLTNYVWYNLIYTQRGYGFNKAHTLSYSIVGLQELNLAFKYNILYWNTANLVVDSGALDEESNDSTNYDKVGVAIAKVQQGGYKVTFPVINSAEFGFKPDTKNDRIIFGLKGINGINTELTHQILNMRPFASIEDFAEKMLDTKLVKPTQMIQLIKGGCFTEIHSEDRTETMKWYLSKYIHKSLDKLTMVHFKKMVEMDILPEEYKKAAKLLNYRDYVLDENYGLFELYIDKNKKVPKRGYHDRYFILDDNSQDFFVKNFTEKSIVKVHGKYYVISEKLFLKEIELMLEPLKEWLKTDEALRVYNAAQFNIIWNKYASGTMARWSMKALCYYDGEHELEHVDEKLHGIVNFFDLPEEPEPYDFYTRYINGEQKALPKFKISRIAGTILFNDKNHHMVSILTKYGIVDVKFSKGHHAFYNKRISKVDPETGEKHVVEDSWLSRGNIICCNGIREGDVFKLKIYNDTIYKHTVNLVTEIKPDGSLILQSERAS